MKQIINSPNHIGILNGVKRTDLSKSLIEEIRRDNTGVTIIMINQDSIELSVYDTLYTDGSSFPDSDDMYDKILSSVDN